MQSKIKNDQGYQSKTVGLSLSSVKYWNKFLGGHMLGVLFVYLMAATKSLGSLV